MKFVDNKGKYCWKGLVLTNIKTKVKEVKTWIPGVSVTEGEFNYMLQEKSSIEKYYNRIKQGKSKPEV